MPELSENLRLAIITGLFIAPVAAWITVQLSLKQFKAEKRWERQAIGYERVLGALHDIKKNNREWVKALTNAENKPTPEKLETLDTKREEAMDFLERAIDLGEFILPKDIIAEIRKMLMNLRSLEFTPDNYNDIYEEENKIIDNTLHKIRNNIL